MDVRALGELYLTFFRIGGLTFGGGLTMLPMLKHELVRKKKWISEEELLDCYAIGQCTPGVIAVNTATFVGYKREDSGRDCRHAGHDLSVAGFDHSDRFFFQTLVDNIWFQHAMMGIKGVVCALMLNTVITMARKSLVNLVCVTVCAMSLVLALFTPVPTIAIVALAGLFGGASELLRKKRREKGGLRQ